MGVQKVGWNLHVTPQFCATPEAEVDLTCTGRDLTGAFHISTCTMADVDNAIPEAPAPMVIETERLRLRTLQLTDAEAFLPIISRPEVMQWTYQDPITDLEQAERWLSARALGPDVFNFAIELRDRPQTSTTTPDIVGVCGSYHWPTVGYLLRPGTFDPTRRYDGQNTR